jgi:hypothetical protein
MANVGQILAPTFATQLIIQISFHFKAFGAAPVEPAPCLL